MLSIDILIEYSSMTAADAAYLGIRQMLARGDLLPGQR